MTRTRHSKRHKLEERLGNAISTILPDDGQFILLYRHTPNDIIRVLSSTMMIGELARELREIADYIEGADSPDPEIFNVS